MTNRRAAARSPARSHRVWLRAIAAALALVLVGVTYVQWRQFKLLDTAAHFQNDALGWSFSQLETEQLRLRNALQVFIADPQPRTAEQLQLRYDIFVSRVGLVDHERAARIMADQLAYKPALAQVQAFVAAADRTLGAQRERERELDAASARALAPQLEALNAPLHDLSLGASHLLYQRATERNNAVRQQSRMGIALTVFQCLLLLALAVIVMRQLRALTGRRRSLEALADTLGAARRDAEEASRAKSAFLANMSHEIRTPFHGMLGMMSLLQDGGLSPQQAAYLDTARESAQHLLTILNDILDVSQLESGRLQVVPQTVDLPQLVAQVEALMRVQAQAKGLALRVEVATDVPRWVGADPTRVKQILFNLLSNALKFTSAGKIALEVGSRADGAIEFRVADSGVGMDEATQARLFQRFVQGDSSPSRNAGGAGLGLEISRDLARLMGGDITVCSTPGVGSTFVAALPLPAVAAPVASGDAGAAAAAPAGGGRRLRVLVAEDHPVNRAYLEAVLDKLGHDAVFMADGDGAVRAMWAAADAAPFDIVLMDLHMPGMDGFAAARAIRAMPGPRARVPIVALTADAFQASRQLAREAGMDGFLTKPAHLPQLREALLRYGGQGAPRVGAAPVSAAPAAPAARAEPVATAAPAAPAEPAEPPMADDECLDLATVADLRAHLAPAQHAALLRRFFDGRGPTLDGLRASAATPARADVRHRAHALKGAALNLGLAAIGTAAQQLQVRAAEGTNTELGALVDRVEQQFDASLAACQRRGLLDGAPGTITPPAVPARA